MKNASLKKWFCIKTRPCPKTVEIFSFSPRQRRGRNKMPLFQKVFTISHRPAY
ncbi:MAG: hypothetical protein LBR79_01655 [Oscillospiraceae bacterium]|nr:hypothetical protein [Oscillospiraceae bacterium]